MLAKNPAGWDELLDLVAGSDAPLVVSINARIADGADPSWLWDVPYERLAGRAVVATGDRFRDLSVRLHYGGVRHTHRTRSRRWPWPRRAAGRPARRRWSTSSGTTPPSTTCWARRHDGAAAHRRRLPGPARAPTATAGTGWCWRGGPNGAARGHAAAGRLDRPLPEADCTAWAGGRTGPRSAPPGRSSTTARWPGAWPRARSCWRSAPVSRSSGGPFPAPTARRTRGSGSSTSTR